MKTPAHHTFRKIAGEKCPHCGQGAIFNKRNVFSFHIPEMKEKCETCGYYFEREPGYFLGAMYISYGLAVLEGLLVFLVSRLLLGSISTTGLIAIVISVIVFFSMRNFRLSRVIWLYIFPS